MTMDTSVLPIIILLPLVLGTTLVSWLKQFSRGVTALGAIGVSLSSFLLLLSQAPAIFDGAVITQTWSLAAPARHRFQFSPGFSGIAVCLADQRNWHPDLYLCLLLSQSKKFTEQTVSPADAVYGRAMLGISLSNNLIILLVFWELTSISSFLLVGYWTITKRRNVVRVWP